MYSDHCFIVAPFLISLQVFTDTSVAYVGYKKIFI